MEMYLIIFYLIVSTLLLIYALRDISAVEDIALGRLCALVFCSFCPMVNLYLIMYIIWFKNKDRDDSVFNFVIIKQRIKNDSE